MTDSRLHFCIRLANLLYDFIEILRSELHHYLMDIMIIASLVSIDHFEDASGLSCCRIEMHCGTVWGGRILTQPPVKPRDSKLPKRQYPYNCPIMQFGTTPT